MNSRIEQALMALGATVTEGQSEDGDGVLEVVAGNGDYARFLWSDVDNDERRNENICIGMARTFAEENQAGMPLAVDGALLVRSAAQCEMLNAGKAVGVGPSPYSFKVLDQPAAE